MANQTVWIPVQIGLTLHDGTAWYVDMRGAPLKGNFDARHIPDHPALYVVARWLAETPNAAKVLHELVSMAEVDLREHPKTAYRGPAISLLEGLEGL